jgi:hypothetical protein
MTDAIQPNRRIAEASQALAAAQQELLDVLHDVEVKERADKTIISTALRDVLDKVTAAKRKLDDAIG